MNYADKKTDEELRDLEQRIVKEYDKAARDLETKSHQYFFGYDEVVGGEKIHHEGFVERDQKMKEMLDSGKYPTPSGASAGMTPEQHYKQWRLNQIGRGERWDKLKSDCAERIYQANSIAASYVNDKTPGIYSLNANYTAYEIEQMSGVAFDIVNEQTVKELMQDKNFSEFRVLRPNKERDYAWNKERIQSALLQGIMQGDSIKELSRRYLDVMQSNRAAAIRNARTSFTSAQNSGRQAEYEKAEELGIEVKKVWVATLDARTRDSHAKLDGETIGIDEMFSNGCEYPGDVSGEPAEVYNCRCTMKPFYPKYQNKDGMRIARNESGRNVYIENTTYKGTNDTKSYKEWLSKKESGALNGALTSKNDPDGKKREKHAERYYLNILNSDLDEITRKITQNSGVDYEIVDSAMKHLFVEKHHLEKGYMLFEPDYYMAESLRRLRTNDNIQEHDLILLMHENEERGIMQKNPDMSYIEAHAIVEEKYNYREALERWLIENDKV